MLYGNYAETQKQPQFAVRISWETSVPHREEPPRAIVLGPYQTEKGAEMAAIYLHAAERSRRKDAAQWVRGTVIPSDEIPDQALLLPPGNLERYTKQRAPSTLWPSWVRPQLAT